MKKQICVLLVVLMSLSMVFAGGQKESGASGEKDIRIAFVSPLVGHPYWVTVAEGVEKASADLGISSRESGPVGDVNIDTQIRDIETAIASKVDGILTMALNPEAFTPVINRAVEAGIPVVLIDTDAPDSNRNVYAGTSNWDAGFAAGKAMIEARKGQANIGIITGAIDADNLNKRIEGFKEAIKSEAGMKVIDVQDSNSNMLIQTEKAQSMLQAHPDMDAFFGTDATSAIAIAKIVEEKGLAGKVTIVGFDDLDETVDYIRKGTVYATTVQRNYMMGYMGIEILNDIIAGNSPKESVIDTGVTMVTAENVDSYK